MASIKRFVRFVAIITLVCCWSFIASRDALAAVAFSFPDTAVGTVSGAGTDGFRFTANVDLVVTALGYYDRGQDGLTLSHQIGIYDFNTQALLASATADNTSVLDGLFRYTAITPFSLQAGTTYVVAGYHPGSATQDLAATPNIASVTIAPEITYGGYFYDFGPALAFPTTAGSPSTFYGPNFQFQAVPEPTTLAMFAFGAGVMGICALRRRLNLARASGTQ